MAAPGRHPINPVALRLALMDEEGLFDETVERKYWIHPLHAKRVENERFNKFFSEIIQYEDKFFLYFRMSKASFDELLTLIRPRITKEDTQFRNAITAEERLTITLRYLSTGTTFTSLAFEFFVAGCTIAGIVRETCIAIWEELHEKEMPIPDERNWKAIAEVFYEKTNFPNCVGTVDGKHIRCQNPHGGGSNFFNYKKYFSIVLMAVVDANLSFIMINTGSYGKDGDSTIFRDCLLGKKLYDGTLNLPPPTPLPNTNTDPMPYVFVGDEAFRIHTNLLRPYPQRELNAKKRVFNYRLSRCRRSVECAFGILASKWMIFNTPILVQPKFLDIITKACCILHNFVRQRDGSNYTEEDHHQFEDVNNCGRARIAQGNIVRDAYADYFMGQGAIPFQNTHNY